MPPPGHDNECDYDDEVLVKRIKKIKQASKSKPKQKQMRSKKCARAQAYKERQPIQKSPKTPAKHGQLSILQHQQQHKSPKQHASTTIRVQDPKSVQSVPKPGEADTKPIKIFQTRMSPLGFVAVIEKFIILYISPDKKIETTPMDMHVTLTPPIGGRKVEEFYKKKPKDAKYNEVLTA
ncbi:hypothetical protein Cgig2_031147 [Carnegiea gigantea]|uniref:Uncharacterized protein n=1 Tax=Carnegiea gigantea TaxID=171969 RepID=A0A9Q1KRD3_9CARY|nr:hypothetical protein Cgig2_031147 [Carnegiea gigantea]